MSPRLLVVDDDAALNLALRAHFEDRGWQTTGVYGSPWWRSWPDCCRPKIAEAG